MSSSIDILFTKSVLITIYNLEEFLKKIKKKLKHNGKIVFIENGKGNFIYHYLKKIFRSYVAPSYFTKNEINIMRNMFDIIIVKRTFFPKVYLICGYNN